MADQVETGVQTFTYGDILAFHRNYSGFKLTHFAIYIDDIERRFPGQKGNLFHITGKFWSRWWRGFSDIVFGDMSKELKSTMRVWNYLDDMTDLSDQIRVGTPQEITARIRETLDDYPLWCPRQNCEHLATYIRYGIRVSLQFGETMEGKCRPFPCETQKLPKAVEKIILKRLHEIYDGTDDKEFYTNHAVSPARDPEDMSGPVHHGGGPVYPSGGPVHRSGAAERDDTWFACGGTTWIVTRTSEGDANPNP